jgi:homoserine acetyltransferase
MVTSALPSLDGNAPRQPFTPLSWEHSMGGMHTWVYGLRSIRTLWNAAMPLASLPVQIAGPEKSYEFGEWVMDSIKNDPAWNGGRVRDPRRFAVLPGPSMHSTSWSSSPLLAQKQAPTRDQADKVFDNYVKSPERTSRSMPTTCFYQFDASRREYDPSPLLETIKVPSSAVNSGR